MACSLAERIKPERLLVIFENVGLRYGMGSEILRDISFRIEPQSFQFLTEIGRAHV